MCTSTHIIALNTLPHPPTHTPTPRYIASLDGNGWATRFAPLLSSSSAVFKQTSPWYEFFYTSVCELGVWCCGYVVDMHSYVCLHLCACICVFVCMQYLSCMQQLQHENCSHPHPIHSPHTHSPHTHSPPPHSPPHPHPLNTNTAATI